MQNNPSYYAILTADVRYCSDLSASEKLLFAEISALTNKEGFCRAGNSYFSELYGVSDVTISRQIKALEDNGFIHIEYDRSGAKIKQRRIYTINKNVNGEAVTVNKNVNRTINKNVKENNINLNNITRLNNITDKSVQLVNTFIGGLKKRYPKIDRNEKQRAHYVEIFDRLLEKYTNIELIHMINFVFNSDFWSKFVITADKLEQHAEKLYAQCKDYYKITEDTCENENVDF
jgi:DNA-binding transcriptional ArsR family regulator